jgi:(2S)-methylsuccinyl-CoA dehydrogenase
VTPTNPITPDLAAAADAVALAQSVVSRGVAALAEAGGPDSAQVLAYDVAHAAAAVRTAEAALSYGSYGDTEARIACAFAADAVADLASRTTGRARPRSS